MRNAEVQNISMPAFKQNQQFIAPNTTMPSSNVSVIRAPSGQQPVESTVGMQSVMSVQPTQSMVAGQAVPTREPTVVGKARALYAYEANPKDPHEISFPKGQIMEILDNKGRWWHTRYVNSAGVTVSGIAPSNCMYLSFLYFYITF